MPAKKKKEKEKKRKRKENICTVSKWRPKNRFSFWRHFDFGENLKNHFPKGIFFNEIWLKLGDHEYITLLK